MGKVAPVTPVTPPNGGGDGITDISLLQQILAELQGKNLSSQVFVLTCSSGTNYQAVYDGTSKGVGVRYVKKAIFQNLNSATSETVVTGSKGGAEYIGWVLNPQAATNQAGGSVPVGNGKDYIDLQNFYWDAHTTNDQMSVYCEW